MRLCQTSRRFNVEIQPQLVLLQKTLLNVEGMGRELDPELDLWDTAQPYLENWMRQRIGLNGLLEQLQKEGSQWSQILPQLPRLTFVSLNRIELSTTIVQRLSQIIRIYYRSCCVRPMSTSNDPIKAPLSSNALHNLVAKYGARISCCFCFGCY